MAIPTPVLALIRYVVVYACGRLVARGWTIFSLDPETTDAVVQILSVVIAAAITGIGVWTSTIKRVLARLAARPDVHAIHVDPALADAVPSAKVTAP